MTRSKYDFRLLRERYAGDPIVLALMDELERVEEEDFEFHDGPGWITGSVATTTSTTSAPLTVSWRGPYSLASDPIDISSFGSTVKEFLVNGRRKTSTR